MEQKINKQLVLYKKCCIEISGYEIRMTCSLRIRFTIIYFVEYSIQPCCSVKCYSKFHKKTQKPITFDKNIVFSRSRIQLPHDVTNNDSETYVEKISYVIIVFMISGGTIDHDMYVNIKVSNFF